MLPLHIVIKNARVHVLSRTRTNVKVQKAQTSKNKLIKQILQNT